VGSYDTEDAAKAASSDLFMSNLMGVLAAAGAGGDAAAGATKGGQPPQQLDFAALLGQVGDVSFMCVWLCV
jgi:hypothetical protein